MDFIVFITAILLILCGVLAAAPLIVSKAPGARQTIENLRPFQGGMGIVVLLWGIYVVIRMLLNIDALRYVPVRWIIMLATGLVSVLLGFLMGYAMIQRVALSGNAGASAKGEQVERRLGAYQIPLGVAGIVLGLIVLVMSFR
jgi:hypothetical protein